jgi:hypothetical protein
MIQSCGQYDMIFDSGIKGLLKTWPAFQEKLLATVLIRLENFFLFLAPLKTVMCPCNCVDLNK